MVSGCQTYSFHNTTDILPYLLNLLHDGRSSLASVYTLAPTLLSTGGTLNGEGMNFPTGDSLEMWYKYGEGTTFPSAPVDSTKQSVTALYGSTPIPGFDVPKTCTDYSYKVFIAQSEAALDYPAVTKSAMLNFNPS